MYYNYPRLQINYNYLQKYDILDKNILLSGTLPICTSFLHLESLDEENLRLTSILLVQEWFYGQKAILQNYSLFKLNNHNKKSIKIKVTMRKFTFWNFLDLCLSSIFVFEESKNRFLSKFDHKKDKYSLSFPFDLMKSNFLFSKTNEKYFSFVFSDDHLKNFIILILFLDFKNSSQSYFIPYLNH